MNLLKSITVALFISVIALQYSAVSASAGAKDAKYITSNGKWFFTNTFKPAKSFRGTMRFDGKKTIRFHAQSFSLRGTYRVSGSRICMKIFRLWGKQEKCGIAQKRNGTYYWGSFKLRK